MLIIERAVKGMLPKNRLGRKMYKKLFVYAGSEHPHTAQKPQTIKFLNLTPLKGRIKINIMEKQKNAVGRRKEAVTSVFLSKGMAISRLTVKIIKHIFHLFICKTR